MKNFLKKLLYTFAVTLVFVYGIYTMIEQEVELKNIADEKEVFDIVDNIHVNAGNAFVFAKTSNICRKNKF